MAIKGRNVHDSYVLPGVFATAVAYLADRRNGAAAVEGDTYYNTTVNRLETYDGSSWSAAGQSGIGPGSLDAAANIGTKITLDAAFSGGIEIEAEDGKIGINGALLLLDNDDTGSDVHCLELTNAGTAAALQFTAGQAGDDIQGTADTWSITSAGVITATALTMGDDNAITLGGASDAVLQWDQTRLALTAAADSTLRIGAAAFSYDVEFIGNTAVTNLMKWDLDGGANSVGALVFDNADIDLGDSDLVRFGDSQDFTLGYTNSGDKLNLLGSGKTLAIGVDDEGMDVYWYSENTGDYVYFDETNALVDFIDIDLDLDDDAILRFGTSNDFTIQYIGGSDVLRITGDDLRLDFGVSGGGFDMYWFTEDATNYIYWDEDNSRMDLVDVDLRLNDDARLYFGSDADVYFNYDNTNSTLDFVGNLDITGTLTISGAIDIGNVALGDDEELRFGNSNDFVFHYDSSAANLLIDAAAANDIIDVGSAVNTDFILHGGTATYDVHWDSSENTLAFLDDAVLGFGNTAASPDIEFKWDQTRLNITGTGLQVRFGADDEGMDVLFYGETASAQMLWDESADQLVIGDSGASVVLQDSVNLLFGTGSSNAGAFFMTSDGTDLTIGEISAAGKNFLLGESGKGLAVRFYGDNAGRDLLWVQASDMLEFQDDAVLAFGTSSDVTITWNQTNLLIESAAEDTGEIMIGSTSAIDLALYGNTNTKIAKFNANTATLEFVDYDVQLQDDCILALGTGDDITLMWDQTRLIVDGVAADKEIRIGATNNQDIIIYGDTSTDFVTFDTSEEDIRTTGFDITIQDNDILNFGDADDVQIFWDETQLQIDGGAIFIGDQTNYVAISATGDITCTLNTTTFSSLVLPTHASSSPDGSKSGTTGALYYEQDASVLWVCESGTTWVSTAALS